MYEKGVDCILKCQIEENGKKTAWCQQHDHLDFSPQDARTFEKASICNGESAELTKFLMNIEDPDNRIIESIESAVKWFKDSELHGIRIKWIESTEVKFVYHKTRYDRVLVEDSTAPRIWARFYELATQRPIFCGRDGIVRYSMAEIDRDRRTGYSWYHYAPEEVYALYGQWRKKWTPQTNVLDEH
jgi:PelA/Pel-15E family pectate lyase